jgi:tetratricopeptide (TPR) repeat protein
MMRQMSTISTGLFFTLAVLSLVSMPLMGSAQVAAKNPKVATQTVVERSIDLAENGHCDEAMPLLKTSVHRVTDRVVQKRLGLDGLHCAMTHNAFLDSLIFLEVLAREFPRDPEVLYAATHAYSDLSQRASQDLMREAPFSYQVHQLSAESLEVQGKYDEAAVEYRKILEMNPLLAGIHYRLARVLLSKPDPSPNLKEAKENLQQELELDPKNAGAEYVLGELARQDSDWPVAVRHFSRATKLDTSFSEAYLGLGMSLVSAKRYKDAIPALERYEKLQPDSPTGHFQLALAYGGDGRKEDANREAALQRESAENLEQIKRKIAEGVMGNSSDNASPSGPPPK